MSDNASTELVIVAFFCQVAHLNMDIRSRIEWASLWGVIADHFGTVGSISGSTAVAMYTVDCLRQLALKFLDKVFISERAVRGSACFDTWHLFRAISASRPS